MGTDCYHAVAGVELIKGLNLYALCICQAFEGAHVGFQLILRQTEDGAVGGLSYLERGAAAPPTL